MSDLYIRIDEEIASAAHRASIDPYIFRVDELLHKENKRAYEPEILAIGPYHSNKDHLKMMEGHKLRYIQEFLKRRNESSVGRYVEAMEELEEKARYCYADPVELDRNQFVKMMLFDGIFIMELVRNFKSGELKDILQSDRIQKILVRDILLFENQLPLFVLIRLSGMANEPDFSVEYALWTYIYVKTSVIPTSHSQFIVPPREVNVHHLLGVMHYAMRPSFMDHLGHADVPVFGSEFTRCARELQNAGIKFKAGENSKSLMDIEFENGIMEIPPLFIDDDTELLFRNLIACEQYNHENDWAYVISYVKVMNSLIKSLVDVKILRQREIILVQAAIDDEAIFNLFNKLANVVTVAPSRFCYSKLCHRISKHYIRNWGMAGWRHRRDIWMAKMKEEYFTIALLLLLLTIIQTVCSLLQVLV